MNLQLKYDDSFDEVQMIRYCSHCRCMTYFKVIYSEDFIIYKCTNCNEESAV